MTESALKPCPFCGGEFKLKKTTLSYWNYVLIHVPNGDCILAGDRTFNSESNGSAVKMINRRIENE